MELPEWMSLACVRQKEREEGGAKTPWEIRARSLSRSLATKKEVCVSEARVSSRETNGLGGGGTLTHIVAFTEITRLRIFGVKSIYTISVFIRDGEAKEKRIGGFGPFLCVTVAIKECRISSACFACARAFLLGFVVCWAPSFD